MTDQERQRVEECRYVASQFPHSREAFLLSLIDSQAAEIERLKSYIDKHIGGDCDKEIARLEADLDQAQKSVVWLTLRDKKHRSALEKASSCLGIVRADISRRLKSDEVCDHPFDEDLADAQERIKNTQAVIDDALEGKDE